MFRIRSWFTAIIGWLFLLYSVERIHEPINIASFVYVQAAVLAVAIIWLRAYDWPEAWFEFWSGLTHVLVWATVLTTLGSGLTYVLKTQRVLAEANR